MWWLFLSKKKRLERKIRILTNKLNNLDRINKGYRSEINQTSASIDTIKDETEKKKERMVIVRKKERAVLLGKEEIQVDKRAQ